MPEAITNILIALGFFTVGFTADRVWQDFINNEQDKTTRRENKSYLLEAVALTISMIILGLSH